MNSIDKGKQKTGKEVANDDNTKFLRQVDVKCLSFWNESIKKDPLSIKSVLHIITTPGITCTTGKVSNLEVEYCSVVSLCELIILKHKCVVADLFPFVIDKLPSSIRGEFERPKTGKYHPVTLDDSINDTLNKCVLFDKRVTIETKSRDGKRFPDSEFLYSNRQKVSDMFVEVLFGHRVCTTLHPSSRFPTSKGRLSAREVHAKLDRRNMDWFANFFIDEYVKCRSSNPNHATPNLDKLNKLERRLTDNTEITDDQDSCYHSFITALDSHSFNKTLYNHILKRVKRRYSDTRPSVFYNYCNQLKKLMTLFRFVSQVMEQLDGAKQLMQELVNDSLEFNFLIIHIWWLIKEKDMEVSNVTRYMQASNNLANIYKLILHFLLKDYLRITIELPEWSGSKSSDNCIDNDPNFMGAMIELGVEHSESFRLFYSYCTEGIVKSSLTLQSATSPQCSSLSPSSSSSSSSVATEVANPLRKIRPVSELSGSAFEEFQMQKRLRQWFWWMYPGLKDVIESICAYLIEQHSDVEERRVKLMACLPTVAPSIWSSIEEGPGRLRLLNLLDLLSLELLDRHSTTASFSEF